MKKILALLLLLPTLGYAADLQPEDNPHVSGQVGSFQLGVENAARNSLSGTAGDYTPIAVDPQGYTLISPSAGLPRSEDVAHVSGDGGIQALGVRNTGFATLTSTDGDYSSLACNARGALYVEIDTNMTNAGSIAHAEDAAAASADGGVAILSVRSTDPNNTAGTDGDYSPLLNDVAGRLYVNPWGSDVSKFFSSCGTATATTADVAIKAAVASNRMYVTSITCKNTDAAVAPNLDFKDGATILAVGAISADSAITVSNSFVMTFPLPLRGSVNTAFNFATNTATSSVTCCAQGFTNGN